MSDTRTALLPALAAQAADVTALADGYQVTFAADSDVLNTIVTTINAERKCCPFLQFDLRVPAGGGDFVLTMTGPDGTRTFLDALFKA